MMKKLLILLSLLVSFCYPLGAGETGGNLPSLLGFSVGGKANAFGGTFAAMADDPSAIFWNPAGLAQISSRELLFQVNNNFISSMNILYAGFVNPLPGDNAFGLSIFYFSIGNFDGYDASGNKGVTFSSKQYLLSFAYSKGFKKKYYAGATVKLLNMNIKDSPGNDVELDIGTLLKPVPYFSFGLNLQNLLPTKYTFNTVYMDIPVNLLTGVKFTFWKNKVSILGDASKLLLSDFGASDLIWSVGLEYNVFDYLSLMGGYKNGRISCGLAVSVKEISFNTSINQTAFENYDFQLALIYKMKEFSSAGAELDYFYKGTVFYNNRDYRNAIKYFEKVLEIRDDPTAKFYIENSKRYLASEQWMSDEERQLIKFNLDKAKTLKDQSDLGGAIQAYRDVLNVNPENKEAQAAVDDLKKQTEKDVKNYYNEALAFFKIGRYKESLNKVNTALALNPEHKPSLELKSKNETALKGLTDAEEKEAQRQADARALFEEGLVSYRNEKWDAAIDSFQKSLGIVNGSTNVVQYLESAKKNLQESKSSGQRKKDADAYFKNGLAFYQNKKLKQAMVEFERAVNTFPDYKEAQEYLSKVQQEYNDLINTPLEAGKAALRDNKLGDAIQNFKKVLEIDSENTTAKEYLSKAMALTKDSITLYNNQGDVFFRQGKFAEALKEYRQTLLLDPVNSIANNGIEKCRTKLKDLTDSFMKQGIEQFNNHDYMKSVDTFNKVLDVDPDYKTANEYIAKAQDFYSKNKSQFQQKENLDKGNDYFINRDYETAKKYFQKVIEIDPNTVEGKAATEQIRKTDDSISKINKEEMIASKFTEGIIAFKNKKYDEAIKIWTEIKAVDPNNEFVDKYIEYAKRQQQEVGNKNYNIGLEAFKKGDLMVARTNFKKAIEIDPRYDKPKEYLAKVNTMISGILNDNKAKGQTFFDNGRYAEAAAAYEAILKYDSGNEEILERKALAQNVSDLLNNATSQFNSNQFADAAELYGQILKLNAKDSNAREKYNQAISEGRKQSEQWYQEALSFMASGQMRKAESRLQAVKTANPDNKNAASKLVEVTAAIEVQVKASYGRGSDYFNQQKYGASIQEFNKVLDLRNPYKDAFSLRERALREKTKGESQNTARNKEESQKYMFEGIRLYRNDQLEEAIAQWETVLRMFPEDDQAKKYIQRARYKLEQLKKAQ
jgi:tetratricopeptide (TPR) repeat protein